MNTKDKEKTTTKHQGISHTSHRKQKTTRKLEGTCGGKRHFTYKEIRKTISAYFLSETMQVKKTREKIFNGLIEKHTRTHTKNKSKDEMPR
jgi:hypothetical protein